MNRWNSLFLLDDLATWALPEFANAVFKGTCVLIVALVAAWLLRRRGAAWTHAIWVGALALLIALPILTRVLPGWRVLPYAFAMRLIPASMTLYNAREPAKGHAYGPEIDVPEAMPTDVARHGPVSYAARHLRAGATSSDSARGLSSTAGGLLSKTEQASLDENAGFDLRSPSSSIAIPAEMNPAATRAILIVWLAGFVVCALRLVVSASWLAGFTRLAESGALSAELQHLGREMGLSSTVRLLIGDERAMPMAWGIWRPSILAPRGIADWPAAQRRAVLLHELGHIVRRDPLWQLVVAIANGIFWFHPLVWFAVWRVAVERERACDDLVLNRGVPPRDYATYLLTVVADGRLSRLRPAIGVAMAVTNRLDGRIRSIFDERRDRRPLSQRGWALMLVICTLVALPLAMIRAGDPERITPETSDAAQSSPEPAISTPQRSVRNAAQVVPQNSKSTPAAAPDAQTQRVRELIYVLRHYRLTSRGNEWAGAIRELVTIGKPAVPELVAELDRTDRDATLRALGFTLRAIGDPRAVPALIRAIPKTMRPPGSDFGLSFDDPELHAFMKRHERAPEGDARIVGFGRPVNEILDAIASLTRHQEPEGGAEKDSLRHVFGIAEGQQPGLDGVKARRAILEKFTGRMAIWDGWWSDHWQELVTAGELRTVEFLSREDDPVEVAGLAKFGREFPTGPKVHLGPVQDVELESDVYRNAKSHIDFDTGRLFEYLEGIDYGVADARPELTDRMIAWPRQQGIDAHYNAWIQSRDLFAWLIDNSRWETLEEELASSEPLELGREASDFLTPFDKSRTDFKPDWIGTFLFTTREGGRGIVQIFPKDEQTGRRRLRFRMIQIGNSRQPEQLAKPAETKGTRFGDPVTVKLPAPARETMFLLDLETGRMLKPSASLEFRDEAKSFSLRQNEPFAEWCRKESIDIAVSGPELSYKSSGGSNPPKTLVLTGIDLVEMRALPGSADELTIEHVRDILSRSAERNNRFVRMYQEHPRAREPETFIFRTRDGSVGVLEILDVDKDLRNITIRYRLHNME